MTPVNETWSVYHILYRPLTIATAPLQVLRSCSQIPSVVEVTAMSHALVLDQADTLVWHGRKVRVELFPWFTCLQLPSCAVAEMTLLTPL